MIAEWLKVRDVPSTAFNVVDFRRVDELRPRGLVTTASASANAKECSNMVMPVSGIGWRLSRAQAKVSMNWLKLNEMNRGHRIASEPAGLSTSFSGGIILAATQEACSSSQNKRVELIRQSSPPSPAKSGSNSFPSAPYCSCDQSGEVWHRIACNNHCIRYKNMIAGRM